MTSALDMADITVETAGADGADSDKTIVSQAFHVDPSHQWIEWSGDGETVRIEAWGANSLRVRSRYMGPLLDDRDWALLKPPTQPGTHITVSSETLSAAITNGDITAELRLFGPDRDRMRVTFLNGDGKTLLQETPEGGSLKLKARDHHPTATGCEQPTVTFIPPVGEHLYGMGEYQQRIMDLKGSILELSHRNSQISIPFVASTAGYGFLWNNPSVGRAAFGMNRTEWSSECSDQIDYWITSGRTLKQVERQYADATGHAPMMPEWALGYWQCRLRYHSQQQVLDVAREFKQRGIPLSVIIIDFFHWPYMGDFRFDPEYWPDVPDMTRELHGMGVRLMVSVWPQVEEKSENHALLKRLGLMAKTRLGKDIGMWWPADSQCLDMTNPRTRAWLWHTLKANYVDQGVDAFWIDNSEPNWAAYDYGNHTYYAGPALKIGNLYPNEYNRTFHDGLMASGHDTISLTRAIWAGGQRYGALVWSGDVHSTFNDLRNQIIIAIHMGMAGIPWFTTDMGGFAGGDSTDPGFHELLMRWCAFSCFSPIMRNHGDRGPGSLPVVDSNGRHRVHEGHANEPWSYTPQVEQVMTKYIRLRDALRPYLRELYREAHEQGQPIIRGLFYEFPEDEHTANIMDEFMLGSDLLVAPIVEAGARSRSIYLPGGRSVTWLGLHDRMEYEGGRTIITDAPLDVIPVFARSQRTHGLENLI